MAESFRWNLVFIFLLQVVICRQSRSSSAIELNIEIAEELAVGTEVADLAADAGLDEGDDDLLFDVVSGSFYEYFTIGGDATVTSHASGHLLIVDRTFDRDVICYHRSAGMSLSLLDLETGPQWLRTLLLLFFLVLLLPDLRSAKTFAFHNRSSPNCAYT